MSEEKSSFTYKDSGNIVHEIDFTPTSFNFAQKNKNIHDEKLQTKPTTFFKDAIKRFAKNKSSVVGAVILGLLLVLSFVLPVSISHDTASPHPEAQFLEPKLFDVGTVGFWDGTKRIESAVCSSQEVKEDDDTNYKNTPGYLYPAGYSYRAVLNLSAPRMSYVNMAGENVSGGMLRLINDSLAIEGDEEANAGKFNTFYTFSLPSEFDYEVSFALTASDDSEYEDGEFLFGIMYTSEGYQMRDVYFDSRESEGFDSSVEVDMSYIASQKGYDRSKYVSNAQLFFELLPNEDQNSAMFMNSFSIVSNDADEDTMALLDRVSFSSPNELLLRSKTYEEFNNDTGVYDTINNMGYRDGDGLTYGLYKGEAKTCSFTLDTYENALGVKDDFVLGLNEVGTFAGWSFNNLLEPYLDNTSQNYINRTCDIDFNAGSPEEVLASFKILKPESCPIISLDSISVKNFNGGSVTNFTGSVYYYRYKGYGDKMPRFILGTDKSGKDMLKITFSGLRTSLLLGLFTFVICFSIGLVLGAIQGYYGGWVDIIMQRLTEILSGVPWIVVMTLVILAMGSNFWTFALALCLTGWIGTSNLTRTQFYRFKGREYILASRTLGANDARLIFKHVLPNSMGTIITSSVLMIPSVIFSEATISYLGLGLKNIDSLGVILSANQPNLSTYPYTLILPAVIIALIMISFNLFGNGLRDAFNPSLKGED
jgi:ABC-type dipeptide/oligopeptide/nickel transport system permease subunit